MIAAVITKPGIIELQKVNAPQIKKDDVKIRVEGCGICASSLPLWEGREWFSYPSEPGSPGHEGWGIVEDAGDGINDVEVGDRVAFLSYHAYAQYDIAKRDSLIKLPSTVSHIPFPGEPLGCAMNIFERSRITPSDTVAIIGAGFLGALLCQLAKNAGARVIAISKRKFSLDFVKRYGADEVIQLTSTWETSNAIKEITKGSLCTRVIEATGKQEALDVATEIVTEGGMIIVAGFHQDGLRQVNMQQWNWKGIDVINAHERDPRRYLNGMQKALTAIEKKRIDPTALYTHVMALEELGKGFTLTSKRPDGFMKALITIN